MSEQERDEKLGGEIALGLVLLGGLCAFPLGLMADRYSRKLLLVVILAFSSVATLGTAFARGFTTLFWCRSLTGIALGATGPIKFSLLADLFPPSQRIALSGRFSLVGGAGAMAGLALSGFCGRLGWRFPFLVAGALLVWSAGRRTRWTERRRSRRPSPNCDASSRPGPCGRPSPWLLAYLIEPSRGGLPSGAARP